MSYRWLGNWILIRSLFSEPVFTFCIVLKPICNYNQYGLVWSGLIERICDDSEYSY